MAINPSFVTKVYTQIRLTYLGGIGKIALGIAAKLFRGVEAYLLDGMCVSH
jgi:hypothetical protein